MSSPRQVGHRVRDAIAVFEQNKGKIVFSEEKDKKLYSKDRPVRRLPKDNIYLQDDLKNRRNTGALSPSPPPGKDVHSKRIIYSFVPRYQLDCKESSTPNSPTSGSGRHSSSAGSASTFGCTTPTANTESKYSPLQNSKFNHASTPTNIHVTTPPRNMTSSSWKAKPVVATLTNTPTATPTDTLTTTPTNILKTKPYRSPAATPTNVANTPNNAPTCTRNVGKPSPIPTSPPPLATPSFPTSPPPMGTPSESVLDLLQEAQYLVLQLVKEGNDEGSPNAQPCHCNGCEVHLAALGRENKRLSEENASLKQLLSHSKNSEEECQRQLSSIFSAYNALQQHMKTVMEKAKGSKVTSLVPKHKFDFGMRPKTASPSLVRVPSHESSV